MALLLLTKHLLSSLALAHTLRASARGLVRAMACFTCICLYAYMASFICMHIYISGLCWRMMTYGNVYPLPLTCAFFVFFSAREAMCLGSLGDLSFDEEDLRTGMFHLKLPL